LAEPAGFVALSGAETHSGAVKDFVGVEKHLGAQKEASRRRIVASAVVIAPLAEFKTEA
jgi:hypothetical protein